MAMIQRIEKVRKRDGRIVPFERGKISDAIFKAAQSVGGQDRYLADDLAEAVRMYLETKYRGDIPSVEEIQDAVERVLIKTGHARTAKSYILYRQKRARARQIREGLRLEDLSGGDLPGERLSGKSSLSVRRSNDNIVPWDKSAVVSALVRETGLSGNIAELIVSEVEDDVVASKVKRLTSAMIREMVNAKLLQYGFEEERKKHSRIGLPFYDVNSMFEKFDGSPDALSLQLGRYVKREYAMTSVLPDYIVDKHLRGEISVCNIEGMDKYYSVNVPVREPGEIGHACGIISPFVEHGIILRLPGSDIPEEYAVASAGGRVPLSMEIPFSRFSEESFLRIGEGWIPLVFRIEDRKEMEAFSSLSEKTGKTGYLTVSRKTSGAMLVLNRLILNPLATDGNAVQNNILSGDGKTAFLQACSDMIERQGALIARNPSACMILKNFENAKEMLELECADFRSMPEIFRQVERFMSEILDAPLCFTVKLPPPGADEGGFFAWIASLFEQFSERQGICARIYHV